MIQNGEYLKPKGFSGVTDCDGMRKTMKFTLAAGPATIQISSVQDPVINIAIMPVTE